MYAVWRYDLYPFILAGQVVGGPDDDGKVAVKGYDGYLFKPVALVSDKRGKEVVEAVAEAKKCYKAACKEAARGIAKDFAIAEFMPEGYQTEEAKENDRG